MRRPTEKEKSLLSIVSLHPLCQSYLDPVCNQLRIDIQKHKGNRSQAESKEVFLSSAKFLPAISLNRTRKKLEHITQSTKKQQETLSLSFKTPKKE